MQNQKSILKNEKNSGPSSARSSRVSSVAENLEEIEVTAQITVPNETAWAWVVLLVSFLNITICDGIMFAFSTFAPHMQADLNKEQTFILLINSGCYACYFCFGPISSALINRFGFRLTTMVGAYLCISALIITYLSRQYAAVFIFYGLLFGTGLSLINIASSLVIGFYFEKRRALAFSLANTGTSAGMIMFDQLTEFLVNKAGWRSTVLFYGTFFGCIYFMAWCYVPLLSLTIKQDTDTTDSRLVAYLPSVSTASMARKVGGIPKMGDSHGTVSGVERLFSAVSNVNYPTAADIIRDGLVIESKPNEAGTSAGTVPISKITLVPTRTNLELTENEIKQVKSVKSRLGVDMNITATIEEQTTVQPKRTFWQKITRWKSHDKDSRPLYRDDAFYAGDIKNLPEYKQTQESQEHPSTTGIEYQLAVSRVVAKEDLKERPGICTIALRRVLASMLDTQLLKTKSFMVYSLSCFLAYAAFLIPLLLIKERNVSEGMSSEYDSYYLSSMGFAGIFGRFFFGFVSGKIDPIYSCQAIVLITGVAVLVSSLRFTLIYQIGFCCVYGFCMASIGSIRSLFLVHHYGLDKLTNATGIIFLFQGVGSLVGPPIVGALKQQLGLIMSFMMSGFILLGSFVMTLLVQLLLKREKKKRNPLFKI